MNERKVKAIRRKVYGSGSKRNEYRYGYNTKTIQKEVMAKDGKPILKDFKVLMGGFFCIGKRAEYLKAKKEARQ